MGQDVPLGSGSSNNLAFTYTAVCFEDTGW